MNTMAVSLMHKHTGTLMLRNAIITHVESMDNNCGEWVECMGVASWCG